MAGNSYGLRDFTVYLKVSASWDPYEWGGGCMKIGDLTDSMGGQTMTHRMNAKGQVVRDTVRDEVPGDVTFEISMKILQFDRTKTRLKSCRWNVDKRAHCGNLDDPNAWEEIRRATYSKASERTDTGSDWESTDDAMCTLPFVGLDMFDIYHVTGSPYSW